MKRVLSVALLAALSTQAHADSWWESINQYRSDIVYQGLHMMMMVAVAGVLAIIVAIPAGVYLSRPSQKRGAAVVMQSLNAGQAVPKLALLALAMSVMGIGAVPAIFGLWVATLLPIALNTYEGLRAVPPALIEAATGMGMTPWQILWRVELPNALYLIFAGIDLNDFGMLLAGAVPTALLAIFTDAFIGQMHRRKVLRRGNPQT